MIKTATAATACVALVALVLMFMLPRESFSCRVGYMFKNGKCEKK